MAAVKRNPLEREVDVLYLVSAARKLGPDFTAAQAADMLNGVRAEVARQHALALGKSADEANEAAETAQLSVRTIRNDLRTARERAQEAGRMGMAALIDEQIAALQDDLEDSYRASTEIWQDIARSRRVKVTRTKGKFRRPAAQQTFTAKGEEALALVHGLGLADSAEGERLVQIIADTMTATPVEPEDMETEIREGPATAALYGRLVAERAERRKIHERILELSCGRELVHSAEGRESLAQLATQISDPARAREAALEALTDELRFLLTSEYLDGVGPWTPQLIRSQRSRTADLVQRVKAVKELTAVAGTGDEPSSFTFRVVEFDPDQEEDRPLKLVNDVS